MAKYRPEDYMKIDELAAFEALVEDFSQHMVQKFKQKLRANEYGWSEHRNRSELEHKLCDHAEKGDYIDIANFAAMLWNLEML